jgi:hypothetical protein
MKIAQVSGALLRVLLPSARQLQSHFRASRRAGNIPKSVHSARRTGAPARNRNPFAHSSFPR